MQSSLHIRRPLGGRGGEGEGERGIRILHNAENGWSALMFERDFSLQHHHQWKDL